MLNVVIFRGSIATLLLPGRLSSVIYSQITEICVMLLTQMHFIDIYELFVFCFRSVSVLHMVIKIHLRTVILIFIAFH